MRTPLPNDEIDRLVDTLLSQPDRADEVKAALYRQVGGATHPRLVRKAPPVSSDVEDLWDNVPL